jgi:hypothetical protein
MLGKVRSISENACRPSARIGGCAALAIVLGVFGVSGLSAQAQLVPVFGDPSTITAAATTAFTAIATFMVGALGFWVIYRLVKRIRA